MDALTTLGVLIAGFAISAIVVWIYATRTQGRVEASGAESPGAPMGKIHNIADRRFRK